jgi:regulator of sirC expression with transglutaminase-like and TPR domain
MDPLDTSSFSHDLQFQRLLRHESDVDLTRATLEIARDFQPELDFCEIEDWITAQANAIRPDVLRAKSSEATLEVFCEFMSETLGFHGCSEALRTPEGSFLNRVIETRAGLPITLSVLYIAVADQIGISLAGVSSPQHFLVRCDDSPAGPVFIDPFHHGRILSQCECLLWLRELTGLSAVKIKPALRATNVRTIIERILNNLRNLYICRNEWKNLRLVQHRLALLNPLSYAARRDLGFATMKSGRPGAAIDIFEDCLGDAPEQDRSNVTHLIDEAHRLVARWN